MERRRIANDRAPARSGLSVAAVAWLLAAAASAEAVRVVPDQPVRSLAGVVEVLVDSGGALGIDEVRSAPVAGRFRSLAPGRDPSFGITSAAVWLRFRLLNPGPEPVELLLKVDYPPLDRLELFTSGDSPLTVGDRRPFAERPFLVRYFLLPLTVAAGDEATFHLRVESIGVLAVPLQIGGVAPLLEQAHRDELLLGILYGVFLCALLYNLFIWLSLRDAVNLYLVGHIASVSYGLACVDGLTFRLWPGAIGWQQWATHLAGVLVPALTLLFVRTLLDTRRRSPRLDRWLLGALAGLLATTALAAFGGRLLFMRVTMFWLIVIGGLLGATVAWHAVRGRRPARIYLWGWVVFLGFMLVAAAASFGLLPNFVKVVELARVAAASEVLLAAVAVASSLRETRDALAASEAKFARAFRSSPDALTITEVDSGRFLDVNDAFERISGHRRAEVIGRTAIELGIWPPGAREAFVGKLARDGSVRRREGTIFARDGREIPVQFSAEMIELDGRRVLLATTRDTTERELAVQQTRALIAELEAKNSELERFTYTASHDLRSPLVTVLGFLGVLERDLEHGTRKQATQDIRRIRDAARHMRRLLDELLELSRVGRVLKPPGRVALARVAEEAAELVREALDERRVELSIAADLPVVWGDRSRLVQVFQNLLDNAIRFGGEQPRVEVGARRDGDEVVCFVRDDGIGIEPRYHTAVFELFRRLRPGVQGTGVGLALVHRIIDSHGGRIWVESEGDGRGSTFCFVIPEERPGGPPEGGLTRPPPAIEERTQEASERSESSSRLPLRDGL